MRIEPASISTIQAAEDGSFIEVSADAGTVAGDLQKIDKGLLVRLKITDVPRGQERFIIYHRNHSGCEHNHKDAHGRDFPDGSTYLVSTWPAYQNSFGTWEGLDQRAVHRFHEIGSPEYDYANAIEQHNAKVAREQRREKQEHVGELAERAAHALRKDLGARYKGRAFKPREVN